jgi:CBS domain-containing protein
MITDFKTLHVHAALRDAVQLVLAGSQRDFPVLDGERLAGILTRDALMAALATEGPEALVHGVMTPEFVTADAREMLEPAFRRLQHCECTVMPVLLDDRLVGLLTPENVGEFVMIRSALGSVRRRVPVELRENRRGNLSLPTRPR